MVVYLKCNGPFNHFQMAPLQTINMKKVYQYLGNLRSFLGRQILLFSSYISKRFKNDKKRIMEKVLLSNF